jgi:hypothetical protein
LFLLAAFGTAPVLASPPERTLMVDPVELIAGREVPGKAEVLLMPRAAAQNGSPTAVAGHSIAGWRGGRSSS